MEAWAKQGGSLFPRVAFLNVSVDQNPNIARAAALSFGQRLQMDASVNSYSLLQPRAGQLGCSGFTILQQDAGVVKSATPSYLQHGPQAHRWVEQWLWKQCAVVQKAAPVDLTEGAPGASSCSTCSKNNGACVPDAPHTSSSLQAPRSVGHDAMDAEHEECTQALKALLRQTDVSSIRGAYEVLESHFQHEEQMMGACGFGGQGPLSGFQSHCNHHAMMLRQLLDIQALVLQTQHSSEKASAAARSLVQAFFDHAEQYDALYEGRLE